MPDRKRLPRAVSGYWRRLRLPEPHSVVYPYREPHFFYQNKLLYFHGKWVCMVNDNQWHNKATDQPLQIDYLYLCKGYDGHVEALTGIFSTKKVIIDSSLSPYHKRRMIDECKRLGIDFVSLAENGAFRVKIQAKPV
jgi:competence protein ComEC